MVPTMLRTLKTTCLACFLLMTAVLLLSSCDKTATPYEGKLKVGVLAGPDAELLETVHKLAQRKYNLDIDIETFPDAFTANRALIHGAVDVTMTMPLPYINDLKKEHPEFKELVEVGQGFIYPMGILSEKYTSIDQFKAGDSIVLEKNPYMQARALLLLASAQLITLGSHDRMHSSLKDITSNPKQLVFVIVPHSQMVKSLTYHEAAVFTVGLAKEQHYPFNKALFLEKASSSYATAILSRQDNASDKKIQHFIDVFHDKQTERAAKDIFDGEIIPGWKQ